MQCGIQCVHMYVKCCIRGTRIPSYSRLELRRQLIENARVPPKIDHGNVCVVGCNAYAIAIALTNTIDRHLK